MLPVCLAALLSLPSYWRDGYRLPALAPPSLSVRATRLACSTQSGQPPGRHPRPAALPRAASAESACNETGSERLLGPLVGFGVGCTGDSFRGVYRGGSYEKQSGCKEALRRPATAPARWCWRRTTCGPRVSAIRGGIGARSPAG